MPTTSINNTLSYSVRVKFSLSSQYLNLIMLEKKNLML